MADSSTPNPDEPTQGGGRRRRGIFGSRRRRAEELDLIAPAERVETGAVSALPESVAPESALPESAAPESVTLDRAPRAAGRSTAAPEPSAPVAVTPAATPVSATAMLFRAPPVLAQPDPEPEADQPPSTKPRSEKQATTKRRGGRNESAEPTRPPEPITEPQRVRGSTRLEAKRQRRRDTRDTRRRTVVTESEFLARREAVARTMVVREKDGRTQVAVLEDGVLVEHYVARNQEGSLIGNVYLGKVQNVLPSMEAAFVDIGRGRNAVLYSGEVDWENTEGIEKNKPRRIELALKAGDSVLVQVTKDPVGHKGARLTSQISLPGRYLVYIPNNTMNGISRKLPESERSRLKKILKAALPESHGVIVRTAAEGAAEEQLTRDVQHLVAQWERISTAVEKAKAPAALHTEPDLVTKIIRDVFNEDFQKLVIEGKPAHARIEEYLQQVAPDLLERVERWTESADVFAEYRVTEQIEKALDRKVWLPSGGSLVIDRTEAMTVIDVNTGKFVGSGGNLEETVTRNNLEAAEEIVRQLRLRDIGGIVVIDFIDMVLETNRDLVARRLVECLSRDRTKHQVAEVTSLGLVQMTRKKLGLGLLESFSEPCDHCAGRGLLVHHEPVVKPRTDRAAAPRDERGASRLREPRESRSSSGTHEITAHAKNALAQIVASTIAPGEGDDATAQPKPEVVAASTAAPAGVHGRTRRRATSAGTNAAPVRVSVSVVPDASE